MSDRRSVVLISAILVVIVAAGLLAPLDVVARIALGMLLLIVPGYAIGRALLPPGALDATGRAAVALACGLGLIAIGSLLLDRLPSGLSRPAWLALSAIATLVAIRVAVTRGSVDRDSLSPKSWPVAARHHRERLAGQPGADDTTRRPSATVSGVPGRTWIRRLTSGSMLVTATTITLAVFLAASALALARTGAEQQDQTQTFTEFWAVESGTAPGEVRIGITSHESSSTVYEVRVESGGLPFATFTDITLDPGGSWVTTVTLPVVPGTSASDGGAVPSGATPPPVLASTMRAELYRDGDPAPYREVTLQGSAPP